MKYNFVGVLEGDSESIYTELKDRYLTFVESQSDELVVENFYMRIIDLLNQEFTSGEITGLYEELVIYKMSINVPYIIMSNEIYGLKNLLLIKIAQNIDSQQILNLISLFQEINNSVAYLYLQKYIDRIQSLNNIRISSLSDIIDKNDIIQYYEAHLDWLSSLASHIQTCSQDDFPEMEEIKCGFGQWLDNDAKKVIHNNSKFKVIKQLHADLHMFSRKIFLNLQTSDYHVLISYLEKCELISLGIGTELTLIDNIEINKKMAKDNLTGALNRHSLGLIFKTQYELSYATGNSFVFAMCDLDYFKKINDTYGHVCGDKMLSLFVQTIKDHIRSSDMVIRYGGEEFLIILSSVNKKRGFKVLEKIRQSFESATLCFEEQEIKATVSMGATCITPAKSYKNALLEEYVMIVDKMLYDAKENGRNCIETI